MTTRSPKSSPKKTPASKKAPEASEPTLRNVPAPVSTFVGRTTQIEDLAKALANHRLVTLCGPPGIGKTRSAIEMARDDHLAHWPDGAWWVDLVTVSDLDSAAAGVSRAMGVEETVGLSPLDSLVKGLGDRRILLILDNCEHVIELSSLLATALLEGCENLTVLATSRQPLGIAGESRWEVPPLSLPPPGAGPDEVTATEAGELFCVRAKAAYPAFELDAGSAAAAGEICRRLDGIPLAIELAAARVGVLSAGEIAARLDDRFALLGPVPHSFARRHRTLAEALDWSYELLSRPQQSLLRRLSVFPGDFTFDAVEGICAGGEVGPAVVLDLLAGLVSKSLVVARTNTSPARYRLLESVRAYAAERLSGTPEAHDIDLRHARWYLALAEAAEPHLTGREQAAWLERLGADYHNLWAAIQRWARDGSSEELLRLTGALSLYWRLRGGWSDWRRCLRTALVRRVDVAPAVWARALWGGGLLCVMTSSYTEGEDLAGESLEVYRQIGDAQGQARCLLVMGNCRLFAGRETALETLEQSAVLAREAEDSWCLSHALALAAQLLFFRGDRPSAQVAAEEALLVSRRAEDPQGQRIALTVLGETVMSQGDNRRAESLLEEAWVLSAWMGDRHGVAAVLHLLGTLATARGDYAGARRMLTDCLQLLRQSGVPVRDASILLALGSAALADGDLDEARRWFEESRSTGEGPLLGMPLGHGRLALASGDLDAAQPFLEEALRNAEAVGHQSATADALAALADWEQASGRFVQAERRHRQALEIRYSIGDVQGTVESLDAIGVLATRAGDYLRAARLLAVATQRRTAGDYARTRAQQAEHETAVAAIRQELGEEAFTSTWEQAAGASMADALAYAGRGRGQRGGRPVSGWDALSGAERDVAHLVGEGLTNALIGERLFISYHTVKKHLASVFTKLGVSSRAEVAREVERNAPK